MEVDSISDSNDNIKISEHENMETDDIISQVTTVTPSTSITAENYSNNIEKCISRVLDASWNELCDGQILVKETAKGFYENLFNKNNMNELISEVILEIIQKYYDGDLSRKTIQNEYAGQFCTLNINKKTNDKGDLKNMEVDAIAESVSSSNEACTSKPCMMQFSSITVSALDYLIKTYDKSEREFYNFSLLLQQSAKKHTLNNAANKEYYEYAMNTMRLIQTQLINFTVLLLNDNLSIYYNENAVNVNKSARSPLLMLMYDQCVPDNFLRRIIVHTYEEDRLVFENIFTKILFDLFNDAKNASNKSNLFTEPLDRLNELINISTPTNEQPICELIINIVNFLPELCTSIKGREMTKTTFLAPFLSLSVLTDENPKFSQHHFMDNEFLFDRNFKQSIQSVRKCQLFHLILY